MGVGEAPRGLKDYEHLLTSEATTNFYERNVGELGVNLVLEIIREFFLSVTNSKC